MARARSQGAKQTAKQTAKRIVKRAGQFKCPECGKTFATNAALGSHRRNTHGVAGASSRTQARIGAAVAAPRPRGRPPGSTNKTTQAPRRRRARPPGSTTQRPSAAGVNRNALLQALFPGGIPANEGVLRSLNAWLDEAERIARAR
jgi:predicted RNA-binding Zn-ribbon protein involved in translation (DUF1610 family)